MKKVLSALALMLITFAFMLGGCGSSIAMPAVNAAIKGNGGFVVQKGEYIYFANAYTSYHALGNATDAVKSTDEKYGIYRVKTSSFLNGAISFDEDGYPNDVEKIVAKVSAFENNGLFIVGDYLFFASPNTHKTNRNENRFDLITIFSVKLDGSQLRELYTTNDYTNGDWTVLSINNKAYLITRENKQIIRHEINNGKISNKTVLASDVVSSILVDQVESEFDHYVYFTTGRTEEEIELGFSGNILKKVNIATGEVLSDNNPLFTSISILNQQHGKLFYTTKQTNSATKLYVKSLTGADKILAEWTDASKLFFFGYENDNSPKHIVFNSQSKLVSQSFESASLNVLVNSDATPLFVSGDYVYYSTSENISRVNYKQPEQAQVVVEKEIQKDVVDFDGRYMYVFVKIDGSESSVMYLHRIDTFALDASGEAQIQLVAFVPSQDRPKQEEEK